MRQLGMLTQKIQTDTNVDPENVVKLTNERKLLKTEIRSLLDQIESWALKQAYYLFVFLVGFMSIFFGYL